MARITEVGTQMGITKVGIHQAWITKVQAGTTKVGTVTGGLKMLNSGGIKMSTCQSLTSNLRGCVDAGLRGIPHVARFIQQRIEHQRDRQKNRTQPWNGKEIPSLSSSPYTPGKIKEAQQIGWL